MYALVLLAHSWLRYVVLALGIFVLARAAFALRHNRDLSEGDMRLARAFVGALDLQLLLGLLLYVVLSPIAAAALADLGIAMKDATLRFFGVEHALTMLLAVIVAHVGHARARRWEGNARVKTTLRFQLVWLVLTLAAIPWPGLDVGRPLLRL